MNSGKFLSREEFKSFAQSFIGRSLTGVRFTGPFIEGLSADEIREVSKLELYLHDLHITFAWQQQGDDEFLEVVTGSGPLDISPSLTETVAWKSFLNQKIIGVWASWHITHEGCPEMLWATTLEFNDNLSLTIALGELTNGTEAVATYMPDSCILIFDKQEAEAYLPISSSPSAWGEKLI